MVRARTLSAGGLARHNAEIAIAALPVFETLRLTGRPTLFAGMDLLNASVITLTVTDSGACIEVSGPQDTPIIVE